MLRLKRTKLYFHNHCSSIRKPQNIRSVSIYLSHRNAHLFQNMACIRIWFSPHTRGCTAYAAIKFHKFLDIFFNDRSSQPLLCQLSKLTINFLLPYLPYSGSIWLSPYLFYQLISYFPQLFTKIKTCNFATHWKKQLLTLKLPYFIHKSIISFHVNYDNNRGL